MRKAGAFLLVIVSLAVAISTAQPPDAPEVRLILVIAADQFRYDSPATAFTFASLPLPYASRGYPNGV